MMPLKWAILPLIIVSISCSGLNDSNPELLIEFTLDPRLDADTSGYYHLVLDSTRWRTGHEIAGTITAGGKPIEFAQFLWESSHYWLVGDSIGYLVLRGNDDLIYTSNDTLYSTQFYGQEMLTVDCCSYSDYAGEVYTVFVPVWSMRGDTAEVYWMHEFGGFGSIEIVLD